MIEKIFERILVAMAILMVLPCIISIVLRTLGPIAITVGVVALIVGACCSIHRVGRSVRPRKPGGGERTPVLPGDKG